MRYKHLLYGAGLLLLLVFIYGFLYVRWQHLWALEEKHPIYSVRIHDDDTLRITMIGDSWAGMHQAMDSSLQRRLSGLTACPVIVKSHGKGGEKSRGIYSLMFEDGQDGTRRILSEGPDYCIVLAGINDAAANRGVSQYLYHYRLILNFLSEINVRPVIIEIPNVNIWTLYREKPIKDLIGDYLKSKMTRCDMYNYHEYREALLSMLVKEDLMKDVVFIPMEDWNGVGEAINERLFLSDQIHLNHRGYELLDSCIAVKIAEDYIRR